MRFVIQREELLKPLQLVAGAVERKQTMPILSNVRLELRNNQLSIVSTDLEIEITVYITLNAAGLEEGATTVPCSNLLDICKVLPENASIDFYQEAGSKVIVRSERSRYVLGSLPVSDYPLVNWQDDDKKVATLEISPALLQSLFASTQFAMANQDVRYYLNGLLLEIKDGMIWAVASDGHRLALNGFNSPVVNSNFAQLIVPRKAVLELLHFLDTNEELVKLYIGKNHLRVDNSKSVFISKLVDGNYPDYDKAIPKNGDKKVILNREAFHQALTRVAVFSNDILRGVQLTFKNDYLGFRSATHNDRSEAQEEMMIEYSGPEVSIGFNINYLLDILNSINAEQIVLTMKDAASSVLIEEHQSDSNALYVLMPLKL